MKSARSKAGVQKFIIYFKAKDVSAVFSAQLQEYLKVRGEQ